MADYYSNFTGKEVDTAVYRLLNFAKADFTDTTFSNISTDEAIIKDYDTVTISGNTYAVLWQIAPTSSNQVYGIGVHKTTGRLYQIYNNKGTYSATALDTNTDTKNTAGSTNSTSKLFLVGAASQAANPVTYSNSAVYATNGTLYATTFNEGGTNLASKYLGISAKAASATVADSANAVTWENVSSKPASYTPASHASSATTYGVGTASNYGHVKLGAAEQNGATATDGIVAPNGHTHSQYALSSTLAAVATSGSYNDLSNKPTITDTKNTVGSTNSTSKLFLVGATSQDTNPQSYSNTNVYATNGSLFATNFYENGNPLAGKYLALHGKADTATFATHAAASQILYTNSYAIGGPVLGIGATLDDDDHLLLGTLSDLLNENLNTYTIDVDTLGEQSIELRANYALLRTYGQGGLHVSDGESSQSQIVAQSFLSANTSKYFAAMVGTTSDAGFVVGTGKDLNAQTAASLSGTSVTKYGIDSIIYKNITLTLPSTAGKIPSISYSNGVMTVNV